MIHAAGMIRAIGGDMHAVGGARSRRVAGALAAASILIGSGSAYAVNAEHVEWTAYGWSNCTTGTSSGWSCSYDLYSDHCPEVAVVGTPLASCHLYLHAVIRIVPVVNAAGRLVACTSGGGVVLSGSYVRFDSTFNEFDNFSIDQLFVGQMYDSFSDGNPGLLQFTAFEEGQSEISAAYWLINGAFAGSCQRGASYVGSTGSGTVDVQV
jgi:hypothetical protein